jgi:spermidine synthase
MTRFSGLGTGLSTSAFLRHGLNTTIVEIDPAVYDAARTWFGLPDPGPGNVFLEDARKFVEERSRKVQMGNETNVFDIVVHDCFSGGGVPKHIFTTEFWSSLKQIMDPEGILVVVSFFQFMRLNTETLAEFRWSRQF